MTETARSTIDQGEVDRFSAMAAEWWSPTGKFKPLHKFNPVRLAYIRDKVCENFGHEIPFTVTLPVSASPESSPK